MTLPPEVRVVARFETHEVINQPPPLEGYDVYGSDAALMASVEAAGATDAGVDLHSLGRAAGDPRAIGWGEQANAFPPVLHTHDRYGHRFDQIEFHPAYHELMRTAIANGLHASPWTGPPGAHVARAAGVIVWYQVEAGHVCPISMTYAIVPALQHQPEVAAEWLPRLASRTYDPRYVPASEKATVTVGMALTEKQGGSDVRANTTVAEPAGAAVGPGADYVLTGHKWFVSGAGADLFLALAQAPGGISCFLVPRFCPDGTPNGIRFQRLKDKLGDRSNATGEVELASAWARMVGGEGRGVRTIIEMVNHTRLDCALGSASVMRHGTVQAIHHARHRDAFGGRLASKPLMQNVLADLAVESEASTSSAMWVATLIERASAGDERAALLVRLALPVVKYWTCKRAPQHAAEALECLGGSGYVEESGLPRLFRQSPVNGVWEGSGNVICLDVLRAIATSPASLDALLDEVGLARGADRSFDAAVDRLHSSAASLAHPLTGTGSPARTEGADPDDVEWGARRLVERMAVTLQASLLLRAAPSFVADAFCASRLGGADGQGSYRAFGTLPSGIDARSVIERALPL